MLLKDVLAVSLISDVQSQQVVRDIVYPTAIYFMSQIIMNGLIGICKAIRKEQIMTVIIAFFCITVNFASLYVMLDYDMGVCSFLYSNVVATAGIIIAQLIIIYRADLDEEFRQQD